jgi:putative acetyltransferase
MRIVSLDPDLPEARALIAASDAYMTALYPPESNHLESIEGLKRPNVLLLGGYVGAELVACGAAKILEDDGVYGEIKSVFVQDAHRGRGYSKLIMQQLEAHLLARGVRVARLETGIAQAEALGLYAKLGYVLRPPFGSYQPDPLSVFMEKQL